MTESVNEDSEAITQPTNPRDLDALKLKEGEIKRRVFFVRYTTTTRPAIFIVVSQRYTSDGKVALPSIYVSGVVPSYMESYQFAIDYSLALLRAGMEAMDWARDVDRI